uniref:hypothetical protein n=1 Tax=Candidatus Electronema sp. TaxID=2698783 RepID=UPI0040562F62
MNQYSQGRVLGGIGTLFGPPKNAQFNTVIEFVKTIIQKFADSAMQDKSKNENALNSKLTRFINNSAEIFFANRESMEDEARGNSPAADIGIYFKVDDIGIDPPLITVFEGKRLSTKLPKKRHQEYVIGHEEKNKHVSCGGIERFKLGIHGGGLNNAGMIGYIQDGTAESWHDKINTWVRDLCTKPAEPKWSKEEQLMPKQVNGNVAEYTSTVNRHADSKLHLTHLWIDLAPPN